MATMQVAAHVLALAFAADRRNALQNHSKGLSAKPLVPIRCRTKLLLSFPASPLKVLGAKCIEDVLNTRHYHHVEQVHTVQEPSVLYLGISPYIPIYPPCHDSGQ